jgi:hypothetical protein
VRQREALTSSGDVTGPAASKEPNAASGSSSGFGAGDGAGPSSSGGLGEGLEKGADVLVELGDVDAAVKEMFDSPHIKVRRERFESFLTRSAGAYRKLGRIEKCKRRLESWTYPFRVDSPFVGL